MVGCRSGRWRRGRASALGHGRRHAVGDRRAGGGRGHWRRAVVTCAGGARSRSRLPGAERGSRIGCGWRRTRCRGSRRRGIVSGRGWQGRGSEECCRRLCHWRRRGGVGRRRRVRHRCGVDRARGCQRDVRRRRGMDDERWSTGSGGGRRTSARHRRGVDGERRRRRGRRPLDWPPAREPDPRPSGGIACRATGGGSTAWHRIDRGQPHRWQPAWTQRPAPNPTPARDDPRPAAGQPPPPHRPPAPDRPAAPHRSRPASAQ